ncbi:MAG TPA: DinB family protein [Thermoanaerobaculia bacterium]|nr:DinB family protein [Thermoanaerobaculia bacterium]
MSFLEHLTRLFTYDDWANRESLASLRAAAAPPPRALRWMAHIVAVERLWLGRLLAAGEGGGRVVTWPDLTLDECEAGLDELRGRWQDYLAGLTPEDLQRQVSYVNTQGDTWTNTAGDILLQTVTHSGYHRGQIAAELRAAGEAPVLTDFIHAVRTGHVD